MTTRKDALQRAGRTFLQLLVAGVFYELTTQIAGDLGEPYGVYITILYGIAIAWAQNELEALGVIRPILKDSTHKDEPHARE